MRRIISLVAALVLVVGFAACSDPLSPCSGPDAGTSCAVSQTGTSAGSNN